MSNSTVGVLSPVGPIVRFWIENGIITSGYRVTTYEAGSNGSMVTFADSTLRSRNPNPILVPPQGHRPMSVWVASGKSLKIVISDPKGNIVHGGTLDFLPGIDDVHVRTHPTTAAETAAGVEPVNRSFPELDPRRYGAVGDGVTVDTIALNAWVAVVNVSSHPVASWPEGQSYLCGPLNPITASSFTWNCPATVKVLGDSWGEGPTKHIRCHGDSISITGLAIDGNQGAFSAAIAGHLLSIEGDNSVLDAVTLEHSCSEGLLLAAVANFAATHCHFNSNAYSGVVVEASSHYRFTNCTLNFNGRGFQRSARSNAFQGFAVAQRFRSHHGCWTDCEARGSGRDGFNVNQGSYAIEHVRCIAGESGDGGFTITCDQTHSGRAGEAESCRELHYVDCESYGNWSSGLAAYSQSGIPACHDVIVEGGRFYNNHNVAGIQAEASSYLAGVYFGGGCSGIKVRARCYDNRQLSEITAYSSRRASVAKWAPGTPGSYRRLAFYDPSGSFQGYGNLESLEGGPNGALVGVTPSLFTPVRESAISSGWYISQRMQQIGCFFDNNCLGTMEIEGSGELPGVFSFTGYKCMSGPTLGGQNVLLPANPLDSIELLGNPTFDSGTGSGTSWSYALPGHGAATWYTTPGAYLRTRGALQLVGGTAPAIGDALLIKGGLNRCQGSFVEASIWCHAIDAGDASFSLLWSFGSTNLATVVSHPGGGWKQLKIGGFLLANATACAVRVRSEAGKTNFFDDASLKLRLGTSRTRLTNDQV